MRTNQSCVCVCVRERERRNLNDINKEVINKGRRHYPEYTCTPFCADGHVVLCVIQSIPEQYMLLCFRTWIVKTHLCSPSELREKVQSGVLLRFAARGFRSLGWSSQFQLPEMELVECHGADFSQSSAASFFYPLQSHFLQLTDL